MCTPKGSFPDRCCPVPHPCGEPLLTHASTGDPPTRAGSFVSVSSGVTAPFLWVLVRARFCVCPPSLESLFPLVLGKSCNQIPLGFKVRFPGDSQAGKPAVGFWTFTALGGLLRYHCSHPPSGCGIWFCRDYTSPAILLQLLVFGCGVCFFGSFQPPPVDACSTVSRDLGALTAGHEHPPFYSSHLEWKDQQ